MSSGVYLLCSLQVIFYLCQLGHAVESDLTIQIGAGGQECFFQRITKETSLDIEYQVIDGGDLDINFYVQSPDGKIMSAESRKSDGSHRIDAKKIGDYKICLDNTFSRFSKKLVFLEVISDDEDDEEDDWKNVGEDSLQELVDMKLEDFKKIMDGVRSNIERSTQLQGILRVFEARDRNIQEKNCDRVQMFSAIQLIVMISVGLTQVLMIRSLFDDKSKVSKIFKSRT